MIRAAQGLPTPTQRNQVTNNALNFRLRYLRNAEAVLALALPGALAWHWPQSGAAVEWALRLPPAVLVGLMLLQGAGYRHMKLLSTQSRQTLPDCFRPLYRGLRTADLIALVVVATWLAVTAMRGAATTDLAWAGVIQAFAVLANVNHFGVQLMHDTGADLRYLWRHRRLQRAALATDLARRQG